jgi:hydroxymethylpyrimidine pyrophosphatase-like HAD family hydrolase
MHAAPPADPAAPQGVGIRLLVLDVDGTLCNSRHEVSAATCAAVGRVREAGIRVVLATGRRYRDVLPVARQLAIDTPLVTASGALVKDVLTHDTLARAEFAAGVLEGVLGMIVGRGHEPILYTDSFADGFDFHCRSLALAAPSDPGEPDDGSRGVADYLHRNRMLANVLPDLDRAPPRGVFAGFTMGTRAEMLDLEQALHAAWPGRLSLHTIRSPRYLNWMCEIAPANVTKWSGVAAMATRWGIAPAAICAVGDDVNDLPMIRGAGLGIAMGNATPDVLSAADRVVATHDDGGIEQVADLLIAGLSQPAPLREHNAG